MNQNNADSQFIWMDGKVIPYVNAQIHVLSHSLHYGCAVFEGIRVYEISSQKCGIFKAVEHYERFLNSLHLFGYKTSYSIEKLIEATRELILKNQFTDCYVRPIAYINDSVRGLKLPPETQVSLAIATWKWGKYLGDVGAEKGIRLCISNFRRPDISSIFSHAKISGHYATSVLARREATLDGYDEALLLDTQGYVAEGSGENLFIVKNKKLFTPPTSSSILPGITRACVIDIARHLGMEVTEIQINRNQLIFADEAFFTGTAVEVTPIREVDHQVIKDGLPGEVTLKIKETFFKTTRGEIPTFKNWLTIV